jgi:gentisate 1,2-dioxygenase
LVFAALDLMIEPERILSRPILRMNRRWSRSRLHGEKIMAENATRTDFYRRIGAYNLKPLWEVLRGQLTAEPDPPEAAVLWRYDDVRPLLLEAARLISVEEADRRVLVLENPALPGKTRATQSLYAGLQIIMPGEVAPCHRHTPTALRLMVEGEGAYTGVDGERTSMKPGDFVITRSWSWHDHGNEGSGPAVWLDGLDVPLVGFLNATFFQNYSAPAYSQVRPDGDSRARFGSGILPIDFARTRATTPLLNYPHASTRDALSALARAGDQDPCHGVKTRYLNPLTGDYAMATIGAFTQLLPSGFRGVRYRSTDSTIYHVIEGSGRTMVADDVLEWHTHDVFVVPSWKWHQHQADAESVLFSFSDRPVQQRLDLWREQRDCN